MLQMKDKEAGLLYLLFWSWQMSELIIQLTQLTFSHSYPIFLTNKPIIITLPLLTIKPTPNNLTTLRVKQLFKNIIVTNKQTIDKQQANRIANIYKSTSSMSQSLGSNQQPSSSKQPPKPLNSFGNQVVGNNGSGNGVKQSGGGGGSKLHQYFASSEFLSSQQQLSIFIEHFPIIDLQTSHKSINDILPLLIKQNQLLGKKCQSQVMLIKQSFSKHEAINKQIRRVKEDMEQAERRVKELGQEKEREVGEYAKRVEEMERRLRRYREVVQRQGQIMRLIVSCQYKKCEQLVNSRQTRLIYQDFITTTTTTQPTKPISPIQPPTSQQPQPTQITLTSLQSIEKHCKHHRRRTKHYSRVKSSVQQFCTRLVKISMVVPAQILCKQLGHECEKFVQIVGQLISYADGDREGRRRRDLSTQARRGRKIEEEAIMKNQKNENQKNLSSRDRWGSDGISNNSINNNNNQIGGGGNLLLTSVNSDSSLYSKTYLQSSTITHPPLMNPKAQPAHFLSTPSPQLSSFQTLLTTYLTHTSHSYHQTLSQLQSQLQAVTSQLQTSKQYYQSYLINIKLQYEKEKREKEEQIMLKDQMVRHFQQELEKCYGEKSELESRVQVLERENQEMRDREQPLTKEIGQLTEEIRKNQEAITKAIEKNNILQKQLTQQLTNKQTQFTQSIQKLQHKLNTKQQQHQTQLSSSTQTIKQQQHTITQLTKQTRHLKETIEDKNVEISRVMKRLRVLEEDQVKRLEGKVEQVTQQIQQGKRTIKELNKTVAQLNQEVMLHAGLVKQLEAKVVKKDQAIERMNKRLYAYEQQKKSNKQITQTTTSLQSHIQKLNISLQKTTDQNTTLKRLTKQMKKQLQDVYRTIEDLKSIQRDRERLVLEAQKSERWKEQIMRDYEEMKFEVLRVEAENRGLGLEVRHYKGALKRLEVIGG